MITVMITVVIITIPVAVVVPLMFTGSPPRMIAVPAMLALSVEITSPVIRLPAGRAMPADGVVESGLRPFNSLLALSPIVRMRTWHRDKQRKDA
ncbi:MAG: hypothetical protein ACHP78_03450 [Terriglobales bacterium]